jgi:hypothetical protein
MMDGSGFGFILSLTFLVLFVPPFFMTKSLSQLSKSCDKSEENLSSCHLILAMIEEKINFLRKFKENAREHRKFFEIDFSN